MAGVRLADRHPARGLRALRRALLVLALALVATPACEPRGDRPRIILIVVDTLRRDHVSVYGSEISTPAIERLAARGQAFEQAVSSFHQTTMSMGSLFTGRTPSLEGASRERPLPWSGHTFCGMARFASRTRRDSCLPQELETLAEDLQAAGYWTAGVVSNRLLFQPYGFDQGFDEWVEVGPTREERRAQRKGVPPLQRRRAEAEARSAEHVNRSVFRVLAKRPHEQFFLYVHYMDVHDHVLWPDPYWATVVALDRELGNLLEKLEQEGFLENTVVVLTSDHGEGLAEPHALRGTEGHLGNPSFEPLLRVPLIVAPPVFDDTAALVRSQDVRGLIESIAEWGPSRAPASTSAASELFLSEARYQTYREGRWKSTWPRAGGKPYLFDLEQDPGESHNLAPAQPEIVRRHRERIDALTSELATQRGGNSRMSGEDEERLRELGYLE